MEQRLSKEQLELCHLLSLALHGKKAGPPDPDVDYSRVIAIAQKHQVTPLLHPVLEEMELPESVWNIIDLRGEQAVRQSYRLLMLSRYVIRLLQKHDIDAILLKGSGTAAWYPVVCESPDRISIELHMSLAEPFDSVKINQYLAAQQVEYFTNRRTVNSMGVAFQLASDGYHAFYLLLHMLQHYVRAGFGIKLLCDWVVFWESDVSDDEKSKFLRLVRESKTFGFAAMMTRVCVRYLGLQEEKMAFLLQESDTIKAEKRMDLIEELMAEIFEAEEFGHSGQDRMVTLRGTKITDYVREFHHQMKLTYPRAGRIVVLYPLLWVMTLCGFLYRNRTLRKVSGRQILQKAKKRSQITEQMRLFR